MSSNTYSAPVYSVSEDLLCHIFMLNADMFVDEGALATTRATSQVCRSWRNLMLSTPLLWSRLIDLDCISQPHQHEWRAELLRRSGAAPLWIRAEKMLLIPVHQSHFNQSNYRLQCLLGLIKAHWNRIQKLIAPRIGGMGVDPSCWAPLLTPAPCLQIFDVSFFRTMHPPDSQKFERAPLFSGYAPALRTFNPRTYQLNLHTPWVANLHCLVLDGAFKVYEALRVLSEASALQSLKINDLQDEDDPIPLPHVILPQLQSMELNGSPRLSGILLDNLSVPSICSLKCFGYTGYFLEATVKEEEIVPLSGTLSRYAGRYFTAHPPRSISFEYLWNQSLNLTDQTAPDNSTFAVTIPVGYDPPESLFGLIMAHLCIPALSTITGLSLRMPDNPRTYTTPFVPFFASLSHVDKIRTNAGSLGYLDKVQESLRIANGVKILFPELKVLKLNVNATELFHDADTTTAAFIHSRSRLGHPISVLDLTADARNVSDAPNLDLFEENMGLQVQWAEVVDDWPTIVQHVCGSDHPEIPLQSA